MQLTREQEMTLEALGRLDFSQWNSRKEDMQMPYDDGVGNFASYFKAHYAPLLNRLADCEYSKIELSDKERRLLGHLRDDLTAIFKEA